MENNASIRSAVIFYLFLVFICTSPIIFGGYFINQDGMPHANNAWIMSRLVAGDPQFTALYKFNSFALPNSIGHWILAGLVQVFSAFTATKIMVIGIFAGSVASAGFLRYQTVGANGLRTSMLLGAVISMNWLWLVGLYNFYIGLIIAIFGIGLFVKWREELTARRVFMLSLLFLLTYFSHVFAVATLFGATFVLALQTTKEKRISTLTKILATTIPLIPLALAYRSMTVASETKFFPTWTFLNNLWSPADWFNQIRSADSFFIISRKAIPFTAIESNLFIVFSLIIWLALGLFLLAAASYIYRKSFEIEKSTVVVFTVFFALTLLTALFGPDHFGSEHGSILRQRILILSFLLFIPVFHTQKKNILMRVGQAMLVFMTLFQTAALADYCNYSNAVSNEFIATQDKMPEAGGLASITVYDKPPRYQSMFEITMDNFYGIRKNLVIWDNYESGNYYFPVVAKHKVDKEFTYNYIYGNMFILNSNDSKIMEKLTALDRLLESPRIDVLMVWGEFAELDVILQKHFEPEPYYRSTNIRLFRRQPNS